jgi:IS5 family transposase
MRQKKEAVLCFASNDDGLPKVVRDYRARYRTISQVLDKNSEILDAVHQDIKHLSQGGRKGRKGDFTSENILRALIVQNMEGLPFRDAVIRIGGDGFLQDFLRTRKKAVMDFTFLDKCFLAIRPETWKRVNELLSQYGVAQGAVNPKVIRADTTVVESNIHYPTDSSLLWDTWRVATRLLKRARAILRESVPHRFHNRKIKWLYLYVTRYMPSTSKSRQRQVKTNFRTLIERVEWIVPIAGDFCLKYRSSSNLELSAIALELQTYLPSMRTIVATARRANVDGETVSASERVFSLFEPHTELIMRGRRQKPVEFGHKVLLCETAEKFITDYEVYEKQQPDSDLTQPVIERHEKLFGERPKVLAADKGFCPEKSKYEELAKRWGTWRSRDGCRTSWTNC